MFAIKTKINTIIKTTKDLKNINKETESILIDNF